MNQKHTLRQRRVRFQYPRSIQRLTRLLASRYDRRRVAMLLQLPLSTVYRWAGRSGIRSELDVNELAQAADEARTAGFDVTGALRELTGGSWSGPQRRQSPSSGEERSERLANIERRPPIAESDDRMLDAWKRIEQEYYRSFGCAAMATAAGLSKFHFIKRFKARFGISPYRALLKVRLRHAKILLQTTLQPTLDVARAVGFETESSLRHAFRTIEGESLSAFCLRQTAAVQPASAQRIPRSRRT